MASTTGLVVIKRFTYRDDPNEEWSNKYWLTGPPPNDDQSWTDLFNEIAGHEKKIYLPSTQIVAAIGYNDNDPHAHAAWVHDLRQAGSIPGTLVETTATAKFAGDQAAVVEWRVNRKNSRGKWIYLRKYFHGGEVNATDTDEISVAMHSALDVFQSVMAGGTLAGGRTIRSQKQDEQYIDAKVLPYVTTRTLKRRGKRP